MAYSERELSAISGRETEFALSFVMSPPPSQKDIAASAWRGIFSLDRLKEGSLWTFSNWFPNS